MKLAELLAGIVPVPAGPLGEIGIGGISVDSRSVRPGDLFIAVPGARADGHAYLADAARGGAAAALVERELPSPPCRSCASPPRRRRCRGWPWRSTAIRPRSCG